MIKLLMFLTIGIILTGCDGLKTEVLIDKKQKDDMKVIIDRDDCIILRHHKGVSTNTVVIDCPEKSYTFTYD